LEEIMTRIRNRISHQRRRARATLALAAACGGLLAAAMAGSPAARADDPFTDILTDVQHSIAAGQMDFAVAANDFSTAGGTDAGLVAEFVGFDNTFIAPSDYVLLGLTAAGTGTDFSGFGTGFGSVFALFPLTEAGELSNAATFLSAASAEFTGAATAFSDGNFFAGVEELLFAGLYNDYAGQAETLATLFSAGI
jgi:hypothetical protein